MIPKVTPFETYKSYLGLKNHFTKEKYDYHKYCGKSRATVQSFYKRKDRFFFEKLSRQKNDEEVIDFFVSNFVECDDPSMPYSSFSLTSRHPQNKTSYSPCLQEGVPPAYVFLRR